MKNLKRIILMISMFAITGDYANCSFRRGLERKSARIRQNEVINQQRSGLSVQLSTGDRRNILQRNRELSTLNRVSEKLWLHNEFPELTEVDSRQIRLILNDDHERQNEFSNDFKTFILGHFSILSSGDLYFDPTRIANTLTPNVNFDQLRQIYLDSILCNVEFIRNLFEDVFFLRLDIKPLDGMGALHTLTLPLVNFLRSNFYMQVLNLNICNSEEDLCIYYDDSNGVTNSFMFNFNGEQELSGIEDINEFLQIDYNFIVECFVRDLENKNLETIECFVQFVVQNFEEDVATEIFNRCLRILNPVHSDIIIERLSNIDRIFNISAINLNDLNITKEQLCFIISRLEQFTSLTHLFLCNNQFEELPESIGRLTGLTGLYIYDNQLRKLPESIGQFTILTHLHLYNNQFEELPESIGNLTNLKYLNISDNKLRKLPESIGQLTRLGSLYINDNELRKLPESIGQLTRLSNLHINYNQLRKLPESIGQLTRLGSLDISANQLRKLPESIGQLTRLSGLDIHDNELRKLPESIGQLTRLGSLDISANQLRKLPESIGNLTNLLVFLISANQLTELPESIGNLTKVRMLNLSTNQLSGLPESIGQLTRLMSLDISDTLIEGFKQNYSGRQEVEDFMNSYFNR